VIDLQAGSVLEEVQVGAFPEQVSLSADGAVGIINVAGDGGVRVFSTADPAATLSPLIATGNDPSDVVFVGSDAVVTNSAGFSYSVLDVSEPAAPLLRETVALPALIPYGVSALSGSARVLLTGVLADAKLIVVDLSQSPSIVGDLIELPGGPFPLGVAIDADDRHAFVAHSNDHTLSIVALDSGEAHAVRWLDQPGPTYVALAP
jgi:DNA-binding beta-propeller fold protein YncE